MSVEYYLYNKPLNKEDILKQTDLTIKVYHNIKGFNFLDDKNKPTEWIVDPQGNNIRISASDGDQIYELENHGFKNVNYIMDILISTFKVTFYTCNELHNFFQLMHNYTPETYPYPQYLNEEGEFDFDKAVIRDMKWIGKYEVVDVIEGIVNIPIRD
jgi:hypothetical protein